MQKKKRIKEEEFTYLVDRAGVVHVWEEGTPNERDPWQRAVCGDPGDFNEILDYKGLITCCLCMKKLGIPRQLPLFKKEGYWIV